MSRTLGYLQARLLLLLLGLALAISQALLAWERGAAPVEVLAPLLYIPVFAGAVFWFVAGGLAGAALASLVYGVVLYDATREVGLGNFRGLLVGRVATFVFYGVIIAIAAQYLEGRLRKLEQYDQVDDVTELYNSAFFLEDSELEMGRADRYRTFFSVVQLVVDREAFRGFSKRRYRAVLRDLASTVRAAVRRIDRPARVDTGTRDLLLVVLPETGPDGAAILTGRLDASARELLTARGCQVDGHVSARAIPYPEQPDDMTTLRAEVSEAENRRRAIRPAPD